MNRQTTCVLQGVEICASLQLFTILLPIAFASLAHKDSGSPIEDLPAYLSRYMDQALFHHSLSAYRFKLLNFTADTNKFFSAV